MIPARKGTIETRQLKRQPPTPPTVQPVRIVAVTGSPGAGVSTLVRMMTTRMGAMEVSMAASPWMMLELEKGITPSSMNAHRRYLDFRMDKTAQDKSYWIRAFHRRLKNMLRQTQFRRIVISGVLTPYELAYCKAIGAKIIHVSASLEVRRRRIGVRFLNPPHAAQELMEIHARNHPEQWDVMIDTDEPYQDFVRSAQVALNSFFPTIPTL